MRPLRHIGRGGFGTVDVVEDEQGNQYARKTFSVNQPVGFPSSLIENVKRRFVREAQMQSQFSHPNIMRVISSELEVDPPSFVMPLADSSLDKDLAVDRTLGGQAIAAIMDILAGLEELHSLGITHRDLKPQNVLRFNVEGGGLQYVICDFGLMSVKDTQLSVLTQTGMRMGSDYYAAPEIVADLRRASAASDIYSVGCILHDMFGSSERIPCSEINDSGPYAEIIRMCTRTSPSRRFSRIADLRDAILSIDQHGVASEPQITDFINMLSSGEPIDVLTWERIVTRVTQVYPSEDADIFLHQLPLHRISELVQCAPLAASQLGEIYGAWAKDRSFIFASCDGIANRLVAFAELNDVNCQAEIMLALLFMGTSHNRWYVERLFVDRCGPNMPEPLARRLAMELRVLNRRACSAVEHLEFSIGFKRASLHPLIVQTLSQVCP